MHSVWTRQDTQAMRNTVTGILRNRFGTHPDFEDYLQEAMMHVYAQRNKIPTGYTRNAYIGKMVIHCCYSLSRKQLKQTLNAHQLVDHDSDEMLMTICEELTTYQPEMSDPGTRKLLCETLQSLSHNHRQILLLTAEGYDYKSIAAILKISMGTVRSRLHHARKICAKQLAPHLN